MSLLSTILNADGWGLIRDKINAAINLLNTLPYKTTSVSSVLIEIGTKSFTVDSDLAYLPNQGVKIYDNNAPTTNFMFGYVNSYSGTTLSIITQATWGSGTISDWTIDLCQPYTEPFIDVVAGKAGTDTASYAISYRKNSQGKVDVVGRFTFDSSVSANTGQVIIPSSIPASYEASSKYNGNNVRTTFYSSVSGKTVQLIYTSTGNIEYAYNGTDTDLNSMIVDFQFSFYIS